MGWALIKLGDLCTKITDGSHNPPKGIEFSDFIMLSSKNVFDDEINLKNPRYLDQGDFIKENKRTDVSVGDVLLTIVGTIGRVAVVDDTLPKFTLQRSVAVLKPSPEQINSRFLMYSLQNILDSLLGQSRGVAQKGIYLKSLRELIIAIPSLSEQKRIVAILDKAFEAIDEAKAKTEQNLKNARELFDSYLQQVFSQRGDGWSRNTLGELGKVSMCKRILKKQTSQVGEIPFYKIGTFGKAPDAFISSEIYEQFKEKYSFPKKGDILLSASGTIGKTVVYDGEPAYFQDSNIVWIDNNEKSVLNEFLLKFYKICDWNPSKGTTISRLYNDDLRRIEISYPEISKQKEIIVCTTKLDKEVKVLESIYRKKLESLNELRKSLLQKAFSGELTEKSLDEVMS